MALIWPQQIKFFVVHTKLFFLVYNPHDLQCDCSHIYACEQWLITNPTQTQINACCSSKMAE